MSHNRHDPSGKGRPNALYMGDLELRMLAAAAAPLIESGWRGGISLRLAADEGSSDWIRYDDAGNRVALNIKRLLDEMHERHGLVSTDVTHRVESGGDGASIDSTT